VGNPRDTNPKGLVIFGAGTLARLAHAYFERDTDYEIAACTVDREHVPSGGLNGLPIIPFEEVVTNYPPSECSLFVAIGYTRVNTRRAEIFERCRELGYHLPTLLSSRSHCWDDLRIGPNCFVFDGVVIEPNVEIGNDVIIWSGTQISHDVLIGDHCFLGPNAVVLGDVSVGKRSFIGGNATIRNAVTVAADCVIGAGSVVKKDTSRGEVYSATGTEPSPGTHSSELADL
jgi:sugar O-acyltransferase (sialic acid O-acetyltransferase NeuD family)